MGRLNNEKFAKAILFELKGDFKKNPSHSQFDFQIATDLLSEQFNERVFENIICSDIKCSIKINKISQEVYHITGELNKDWQSQSDLDFFLSLPLNPYLIERKSNSIVFENGSELNFKNGNPENQGMGATPLSNWDYLNK